MKSIPSKRIHPLLGRLDSALESLEELTMRCLSIDPTSRPQSITEVEEFLHRLQTTWSQDEARKRWLSQSSTSDQIGAQTLDVQPAETLAYAREGDQHSLLQNLR